MTGPEKGSEGELPFRLIGSKCRGGSYPVWSFASRQEALDAAARNGPGEYLIRTVGRDPREDQIEGVSIAEGEEVS